MEPCIVYELDAPAELRELYRTHWWFEGRDLDRIRRSVANSDVFVGLRDPEESRLIASARVITDYTYTGKVLDVIVRAAYRNRGVGKALLAAITDHPELQDVDKLTLNCRAGLAPFYRSCGFEVHEMIRECIDEAGEAYYVMVHS